VEKGAWVSHLALAEATWVLAAVYELGATAIATAVEMLHHRDLTLEASEVVSNALETFCKRPALGFSDCLMLEVAQGGAPAARSLLDRKPGKLEDAEKL
jgi:predicted nucleic-acid-binding protein